MIKVLSLSLDIDLLDYSKLLYRQGLKHRIIEESGVQSIYVENDSDADYVKQSLQDYLDNRGTLQNKSHKNYIAASQLRNLPLVLIAAYIRSPVTLSLISVSVLVGIITSLGSEIIRFDYLFYPLIASSGLAELFADINSVRIAIGTLTPVFLHFGELHLVFNMLWLWYFGRQLESLQPVWMFLFLLVVTAFVSNTTQYMVIGYNNFGGMSGVVYGLVGYTWVIHRFMPRSHILINTNMFVFFVIALFLMEIVGSSWIATAAHVGGLVCGLLIGIAVAIYYRTVLKRDIVGKMIREEA